PAAPTCSAPCTPPSPWATTAGGDELLDHNQKDLSTDLTRHEPVQPDHLTDQVVLREFRVLPRAGR
ncbi:MAG: hypothetical protein ACK5SH_04665, partial [Pseudomonadota bacterium]